ncbi:sacsin N-terminal ATP-binding-like domain-containing protein [Acidiphilium multivorum]|uniref:sacsin N-terminal ATP-binding-like domain-containing protein n=1 Tax=Acidiphilium multivorum TaxID=62140 RepID=UPI001B8D2A4C|nr:hypothetical protein [Acidiphilium multivorum]MBS3024446.1 hypothetical protein [Acidiphilium multivorum]
MESSSATLGPISGALDLSGEIYDPAELLRVKLHDQLRNAVDAAKSDLLTYESLRNLNEIIGGEYGDRVVFELVQNAHDAHEEGSCGAVLLRLVVRSPTDGDLFVANGGSGFDWRNVNAIRNVGVSSKTVGEGIGNKGLGFRSVETLTDDPRIYSQAEACPADRFDGFCFRFASPHEVFERTLEQAPAEIARKVADALPRYLATVPLEQQSDEIREFARRGYATVVHLPLQSESAVTVARDQLLALVSAEAPLLLFLDRLGQVTIELLEGDAHSCKVLTRSVLERPVSPLGSDASYELVSVGPDERRYLIAKRRIDRKKLAEAVELSIPKEPQLARWRKWRGQPRVAVSVALDNAAPEQARIYNFLPMAEGSAAPIRGNVDAPFYATIDRRRANLDLPLNAFLMDEVAATALRAAVDLKPVAVKIGRQAIFDLAAWDPAQSARLDRASRALDIDWRTAEIVPSATSADSWTCIQKAWHWPEASYRALSIRRLVKAGVPNLADPRLGPERLRRLDQLIAAVSRKSSPGETVLADWVTKVAEAMRAENASSRRWSTFYDEIHRAFGNHTSLRSLRERPVLRGSNGELHAAGLVSPVGAERPVFVRQDNSVSRARDRERAPLPPSALARGFAILDEAITFKPEVMSDFVKAGLLRRYDALQILETLPSLFADRHARAKRQTALRWAFDVWRAEGSRSEKVLRKVDLHVETRAGWRPASSACFSEGWTLEGRKLSTYLAEASRFSPDCERAARQLLLADPEWAPKSDTARRVWVDFLRAAGVHDGLPLLADETVPAEGTPSAVWEPFLSSKDVKGGRDEAWVEACRRDLPNPYTPYTRRGELWRIPGQVEHANLPSEARQRLADLIVVLLRDRDRGWLSWRIARYERWERDWNEKELLTPAAAFLASARWMPVEGDPDRFERPSDLWFVADRRQRSLRFIPQPRERLVEVIEDDSGLAKAMLAEPIGLRDWSRAEEGTRKLADLARACAGLEARDRVSFRRTYQRAWGQAVEAGVSLPGNIPIAVIASGVLEMVGGDPSTKPVVYVTADAQYPDARAIAAAGQRILEVGEDDLVASVISLLEPGAGFDIRRIDRGQIEVLTDGNAFRPTLTDPLLAAEGLEWLAEAAILANEVLGRELERQISSTLVGQRLRRMRYRQCGRVTLSVGGVPAQDALPFYAYPDEEIPTLVIGDGAELTWSTLGDAAPHISLMLDRRMRSLETLLLRLAAHGATPDPRVRPSDEALARALGCRVELVREHTLALQADDASIAGRLVPLVACIVGIDDGLALRESIATSKSSRSDVLEALAPFADHLPIEIDDFLDLVLAIPDLAELRRRLSLDHGRLNRTLAALGLPILSNETELRRLFETWRDELRPAAIDRLRRHYWLNFESGRPLDEYVQLRTLDFIQFQPEWIIEYEQLEREVVARLLNDKLMELIGPDTEQSLEELNAVRTRCRRVLQRQIDSALAVVRAWCSRAGRDAGPWREGTQEVLKAVDRLGLFDFAPIAEGGEIAVLARAGAWPTGMPLTLSTDELGIDPDDLLGEQRRADEAREADARRRRSIRFSGIELDTHASDFAQRLVAIAQASMEDGEWLTRSRKRFSLSKLLPTNARGTGAGAGGSGGRRRSDRLSEDTKTAMGLASEYLASRFLAAKHRERYDDACWASRNREDVATDGFGDDALGFDFRVRTVEVEWRYEVKSSLEDSFEFEFTANEMRAAAECAADGTRRYRILYVPFVFDPARWHVMELPNPMSEAGRRVFRAVGAGATRYRFEPR